MYHKIACHFKLKHVIMIHVGELIRRNDRRIIPSDNNIADTVVKFEMVKSDEHDAVGSVLLKEMGRATYVQ